MLHSTSLDSFRVEKSLRNGYAEQITIGFCEAIWGY